METDLLGQLILCITNPVAMDLTANSLLAIGDSPLMSSCEQEMPQLVAACDALLVNIGCVDTVQRSAMLAAVSCARDLGKPWVLDPVGVGVSDFRSRTIKDIVACAVPTVIKGNASEILSMAEGKVSSRLDSSVGCSHSVKAADSLALALGCTVVVTGQVDYITDGCKSAKQSLGDPMMTRVTAMGCTAGAVIASFLARSNDAFEASVRAMQLMGEAGTIASKKAGIYAPGTFREAFVDALYNLTLNR